MDEAGLTTDVIVIGGGVADLSTAMPLAMRGQKVIVLERQRLGCGSGGRAAGLLGQLRGTAEHTGMKAGRDSMNVALLIHLAQQRFPWINEPTPMTISTGIMSCTPDGKGLCGPLPQAPGLFHCSCCSGHGIMQSPIVGKVAADLILDGKTKYNLDFMAADRFYDLPGYQTRADIKGPCDQIYASYDGQVEKPLGLKR